MRDQVPSSEEWERKFEVIGQLFQQASESNDLLGTAVRARQVIEHIADYLHVREIGPVAQHDMLDAKLKRLAAKGVLSRREQIHFGTVQIHTNFVIHPELLPREQDRRELDPCMLSLGIIVEWFFRECLRRPSPIRERATPPASLSASRPDATPFNATSGTAMNVGTRFGTGFGEFIPVWRTKPAPSSLRFDSPDGEPADQRTFKLEPTKQRYFIGQAKRKDGTPNDFSLPWTSVSRDQGVLELKDGNVILRNTSGRKNVFVRGELLPDGESCVLRHGDAIQLGRSLGTFSDGRYYGVVPPMAIDPVTGLLSRAGLVTELSGALAMTNTRTLLVVRCAEPTAADRAHPDAARAAAAVALAFHLHDLAMPVARLSTDVAVLLTGTARLGEYWQLARQVATDGVVAGYVPLVGTPEQASPQLDACLGALSRIAIAGREPTAPEDLTRSVLVPTPLDQFASEVVAAYDAGGGAALFVLGQLERLTQLTPTAIPILELELIELIGARMGPRDIVSIAGAGMLAFATPGDIERSALELEVEWHARGPFSVQRIEIDRSLTAHLLTRAEATALPRRAAELAGDATSALGVDGFPAPIVLAARALDEAPGNLARLAHYGRVSDATWQLLGSALAAAARSNKEPGNSPVAASTWQAFALDAARRVKHQGPRIAELATAVETTASDAALRAALETLAGAPQLTDERAVPRVERALRELLAPFGALRGWTLVAVESSEFDVEGTSQRVEYIDYTGSTSRGSRQHVSVLGFRGLGRFVYLVRWTEGIAIALEPFVRRVRNPATGDFELVTAIAPITVHGRHRYRSCSSAFEIELDVTPRQVG